MKIRHKYVVRKRHPGSDKDIVVGRVNHVKYQVWHKAVRYTDAHRLCFNCEREIEIGDHYYKPYEGNNHMHSLCTECAGIQVMA